MLGETNSYWNKGGLLRARPWEDDQNMLLRTVYYYIFGRFYDTVNPSDLLKVRNSLTICMHKMYHDGRIAQHPDVTPDIDPASHDELTAWLFVSHNLSGQTQKRKVKLLPYLKYPQVFFHLLYAQYEFPLFRTLSCLWMLGGVWKKEYSKNGRLETDSDLLSLVKLHHYFLMRDLFDRESFLEKKIMERIRKNWGPTYFQELLKEMLWHDPVHPLRLIASVKV